MATVIAFFGAPQPKNKKRRWRQLLLPSLVRCNQKMKKEGDSSCRHLFWYTSSKKQKKKVWQLLLPSLVCHKQKKKKKTMATVVAFFGALQPKNEKKRWR